MKKEDHLRDILDWIISEKQPMLDILCHWASINSGSDNLEGLDRMLDAIAREFYCLGGETSRILLPPRTIINEDGNTSTYHLGKALNIRMRPNAKKQVLLCGHMDTVYSPSHPFQQVQQVDNNILRGPGVADMKGGLVVMLTALKALERSPAAENIGWEVIINPDEEIGSTGSEKLFLEAANRHQLALLFEPSYPDGSLVSSRKGSTNYTVVAKGIPAHAGRDFEMGRNAIASLADFIVKITALCDTQKGISINVGRVVGGGPVNIVPDFALCRLNMRANSEEDFERTENRIREIASHPCNGTQLIVYGQQRRHPKIFDNKSQELFDSLDKCAEHEGYRLFCKPSGGVCDGNILSRAGLPVIDTLGVIGGGLHTSEEYMLIDSLVQRSRLVARFLIGL